ncbi:MAG TPA: DUF126 domain-containing protein [Actinomycetota bacterium]|nr:DUF126 domain-containing protein [Actinomycetota bacterium]
MTDQTGTRASLAGRTLVAGRARGRALVLPQPLSFWGGVDPATGVVVDRRHPRAGACLTGRVVLMPAGRGSSSSSAVFAEAVRLGTAPAALLLLEPDPILVVGAIVAQELYGRTVPVVLLEPEAFHGIRDGQWVELNASDEGSRSGAFVQVRQDQELTPPGTP